MNTDGHGPSGGLKVTIDQIIDSLIDVEGGYVDNPNDPGGKTNWGVTEKVARANGYVGDMRDMPQSIAREIFRNIYVVKPGFDRVARLSPALAEELVDTGVNMGTHVASVFLQRSLNAFNLQGKLYSDIDVDGKIGSASLTALSRYLEYRRADAVPVMLKALNCLQGARYIEIVEGRPKSEDFVFGWTRTRVEI